MGFKLHHILFFATGVIVLALLCIPPEREQLIMRAQRSKDPADAISALESIMVQNPEDRGALKMLLPLYVRQGKGEQAVHLLQKYRRTHRDEKWAFDELLYLYKQLFYYDKAIALLRERKEEYYPVLVDLCVKIGDLSQAIALLKEQLDTDVAQNYAVWQEIETYQQWSMNIPGVLEALEKKIHAGGSHEDFIYFIEACQWQGLLTKAIPYAVELSQRHDCSVDDKRVLVSFFVQIRDLEKALVVSENLCADPVSTRADWQERVYLFSYASQYDQALTLLHKTMKRFGETTSLLWLGATLADQKKDMKQKCFYLEKIAERTHDGSLYMYVAETYSKRGLHKRAGEIYTKIIAGNYAEVNRAYTGLIRDDFARKDRLAAYMHIQDFEKYLPPQKMSARDLVQLSFFYDRLAMDGKREACRELAYQKGSQEAELLVLDSILEKYWQASADGDIHGACVYRKQALALLRRCEKETIPLRYRGYFVSLLLDSGEYAQAKKSYKPLLDSSTGVDVQMAEAALAADDIDFAQKIYTKISGTSQKEGLLVGALLADKQGDSPLAVRRFKQYFTTLTHIPAALQEQYYNHVRKIGGIVPRRFTAKKVEKYSPTPFKDLSPRDKLLAKAYACDAGIWRGSLCGWYDAQQAYTRAIEYMQEHRGKR